MMKSIIAFCTSVFLISCTSQTDDLKIDTFSSGEPSTQKIVMAVANEGPAPIGMIRICTTRVNEYTEHNIPGDVKVLPGELFIIEQPNWFDERRLCTFTRFTSGQLISVFDYASTIQPKVTGPGIYFMGSVKSPEQLNLVRDAADIYDNEIKGSIKSEMEKLLAYYKDLKPINFTIRDLE